MPLSTSCPETLTLKPSDNNVPYASSSAIAQSTFPFSNINFSLESNSFMIFLKNDLFGKEVMDFATLSTSSLDALVE